MQPPLERPRAGATRARSQRRAAATASGEFLTATGERLIALAEPATGDGVQIARAGWAISNARDSAVSPESSASRSPLSL